MALPKSVDALAEVMRRARTAGELAGLEGLFSAFVRRGSRVESIRIMGHERQGEVGWVYKDFLAREKDPVQKATLLTLLRGLEAALRLEPSAPTDADFWKSLEHRDEKH